MFTVEQLQTQLRCAARELELRKRVYPNWVKKNKMKQTAADAEIATMADIVTTLQKCVDLAEVSEEMKAAAPKCQHIFTFGSGKCVLCGEPQEEELSSSHSCPDEASEPDAAADSCALPPPTPPASSSPESDQQPPERLLL